MVKMWPVLLLGVLFTVSQVRADVATTVATDGATVDPAVAGDVAEYPGENVVGEAVEAVEGTAIHETEKIEKDEKKKEKKEKIDKVQKEDKKDVVEEKPLEQLRRENEILQRQVNQEMLERGAENIRRQFQVDAAAELTSLRRIVRSEYEISQDMQKVSGSRFVTDRKRNRMMAKMDKDLRRLRREREVVISHIENRVQKYYNGIADARREAILILPPRESALALSRLRDEMRITTHAILTGISDRINVVPAENVRVVLQDIGARLTNAYDVIVEEMGKKRARPAKVAPVEKPQAEKVVSPEEAVARELFEQHKEKEKVEVEAEAVEQPVETDVGAETEAEAVDQ